MDKQEFDIKFFTVATAPHKKSFHRFKESLLKQKMESEHLSLQVLGSGEVWLGGDMKSPGGGHKLVLMRDFLNRYKVESPGDFEKSIICFTDAYDVVANNTFNFKKKLLDKFLAFETDIVFSTEVYCWPNKDLAESFPPSPTNSRYLNSGMYIGYAEKILQMLNQGTEGREIQVDDDDQAVLIDWFLGNTDKAKLDYSSDLFMNLNGATGNFLVKANAKGPWFIRRDTTRAPFFVHANGPKDIKQFLDGQYNLISSVSNPDGILQLNNRVEYDSKLYGAEGVEDTVEYGLLHLVVDIYENIHELEDFFKGLNSLNFKKEDTSFVFLLNPELETSKIEPLIALYFRGYRDVQVEVETITYDDTNLGKQLYWVDRYNKTTEGKKIESVIYIDQNVTITDENLPKFLYRTTNSGIVSVPVFSPDFVEDFDRTNFQSLFPSTDEVMKCMIYGNVAVSKVNHIMMFRGVGTIEDFVGVKNINEEITDKSCYFEVANEMAMCVWNTPVQNFIPIQNITPIQNTTEEFPTEYKVNEPTIFDFALGQDSNGNIIVNPAWEDKYIQFSLKSQKYDLNVHEVVPGSDVITIGGFTKAFCDEVIQLAEAKNMWTEKRHDYYPAEDVLIDKLGLKSMYSFVLKKYVYPIAIWNWKLDGKAGTDWEDLHSEDFINRYRVSGQPDLDIHHDSSIYTVLVTLNRDFTGGGTIFPTKGKLLHIGEVGDISIHPGQLTHKHGGRPIQDGTRYVLVSFCKKLKRYVDETGKVHNVYFP